MTVLGVSRVIGALVMWAVRMLTCAVLLICYLDVPIKATLIEKSPSHGIKGFRL